MSIEPKMPFLSLLCRLLRGGGGGGKAAAPKDMRSVPPCFKVCVLLLRTGLPGRRWWCYGWKGYALRFLHTERKVTVGVCCCLAARLAPRARKFDHTPCRNSLDAHTYDQTVLPRPQAEYAAGRRPHYELQLLITPAAAQQ